MTRKRLWEMGATAALLLAVAVAVGGFFAWRERQRRLDAELVSLLNRSVIRPTDRDCAQLLSLLRQGASAQVQGAGGWTVLMTAARTNHLPLLREALLRGAEVNESSDDGMTALMAAANWGSVESAEVLLRNGADPNYRDTKGDGLSCNTALSCAELLGHARIVHLLKQHGAKE
jgi:ankyrin repeat protein